MLKLEDVVAGYGRNPVLRGLSLEVGDGEVVTVLGANGGGKTTLMRTITGLLPLMRGRVLFNGADLGRRSPEDRTRLGMALVPEGRRVFSMLTVRENLLLASRARGRQPDRDNDLKFVYELFPILEERSRSRGDQLSGGQQQMVALGRIIMQRPTLVLLDEPSIGLAPIVVQDLPRMITGVRERTGAAILLVEQDAGMALELADRGYVLNRGEIVEQGSAETIGSSAELLESYLGSTTVVRDREAGRQ